MNEQISLKELESKIDELIEEYKKLQLKAMDDDNRDNVIQFTGSMIGLNCLKEAYLGIREDDEEKES